MPAKEPQERADKLVIAIEAMPEDFLAALQQPVDDPELAALDHLLDDSPAASTTASCR